MDEYAGMFSDAHGSEPITITNDGRSLRLLLRGVEFIGHDFDCLTPIDATPADCQRFCLEQDCLCSCRIECRIPIPIQERDTLSSGLLFVELALGDPVKTGGIDGEHVRITLEYANQRFASRGTSGWFEDELLDLQKQLPEGVFIKACINCLYSDYSPTGHGLFGSLLCFRNIKAEYLRVTSKQEYWPVLRQCEGRVQETYLCPEFERRIPGTGYRG